MWYRYISTCLASSEDNWVAFATDCQLLIDFSNLCKCIDVYGSDLISKPFQWILQKRLAVFVVDIF